jgi:translation elongation factor EF-1alpha
MAEVEVGVVKHYFNHISVAAIELKDTLTVGDTIHVKGHTSDFTCPIESMQIEHEKVEKAGKGDSIGIKVPEHVREHDVVYKVTAD